MLVSQVFKSDGEDYRTYESTTEVKIIELTSDGEILTVYLLNTDLPDFDQVDFLQNHAGKILQVNAKFCDSSK